MSATGSAKGKYDDGRTTDWVGRIEDLAWSLCLSAYEEGSLDVYEENRDVVKRVQFLTAFDELVCPDCGSMNGVEFEIDEARGILPLHPWCRCTWVPLT
jgi:SPP1 gp7 family putative phage head morphogenesis protein